MNDTEKFILFIILGAAFLFVCMWLYEATKRKSELKRLNSMVHLVNNETGSAMNITRRGYERYGYIFESKGYKEEL